MEHRSSPRNDSRSVRKVSATGRPITSFTASTADPFGGACVICKTVKHPLYACTHFKLFSHDKMVSILRANNLCFNCFKPGHGVKQCRSIHCFQKCQKPHHTVLHYDNRAILNLNLLSQQHLRVQQLRQQCPSCQIQHVDCNLSLYSCSGQRTKWSTCISSCIIGLCFISFICVGTISEEQPRSRQNTKIYGVAGISHSSKLQSIANLCVFLTFSPSEKLS